MSDVTSVMTANPAHCQAGTPLPDVAQMMIDSDCGMIPVVDEAGRPIGTPRWAGAVDSVGSHTLANVLAQTDYRGVVAACSYEARAFGVTEMPQGPNWLRLPDGLAIEFIQAKPASCPRNQAAGR